MTRAAEHARADWAKAPDFHADPERLAAVHAATDRDRSHYLRGGMRPIECRTCHAQLLVKKTSPHHTSVQWNEEARAQCVGLGQVADEAGSGEHNPLLPGSMMPTCPRLSASIDHAVAEGIIPAESPAADPDGYW